MLPVSAATASLKNLLDVWILGPEPKSMESATKIMFNKPSWLVTYVTIILKGIMKFLSKDNFVLPFPTAALVNSSLETEMILSSRFVGGMHMVCILSISDCSLKFFEQGVCKVDHRFKLIRSLNSWNFRRPKNSKDLQKTLEVSKNSLSFLHLC